MASVEMIGRLLVSLAVVLGVMWVIARKVKRGGGAKNTRLIDVLGRQQLSRNASVAVIRVLDQAVIVGVTDGQVTVLGEADLAAAQELAQVNETGRGTKRGALGTIAALTNPNRTAAPAAASHRVPAVPAAAAPAAQAAAPAAGSAVSVAQARAAEALAAQALAAAQLAQAQRAAAAAQAAAAQSPGVPAARIAAPAQTGALAGSALSPQTWKQTIESLRDLTTRAS